MPFDAPPAPPANAVRWREAVPAGAVRVMVWEHPLSAERRIIERPAGASIAELLDACELAPAARGQAQAWLVDGEQRAEPAWIEARLWAAVRPKGGTLLIVRVVPGKKSGKGFLGILLSIVTAAVGFLVPGIGGALIGFGLKLLGSVLIPKPKAPKSSQSGGGIASSPTYSVTGSRNQPRPYEPIARQYGRHRRTPDLGALPFTEIVGDDQYLRMVFDFGYGPLLIEDMRIGETPLASFDDVEYEIRQGYADDAPLTLYTQDVFENPLSVELTFAGGAAQQVSQASADELSIDVTFDRGLGAYFQNGVMGLPLTVVFKVEYRLFGSAGAWTDAGNLVCTAATATLARRGKRWAVSPRGQYEVQLTRLTAELVLTNVVDHSIWTTLRTITARQPSTQTGTAKVAVRIRASDQLNGVIDQFNAICTAMLPTWSASSSPTGWSGPTATRNPAWAYLDALRGAANKRPIPDARIDLEAFAAWAAACDALAQDGLATYTFDAVFDFRGTLFDALRAIAAAGRGSFAMVEGKYSVVLDTPQAVPVQHFTPRNSFNFKGTKAWAPPVHALKVQFRNEAAGWQQDELTVYADGFDEDSATEFEGLETFGITRAGQAWREGRYHQAVAILRPESWQISVDIEHIVAKRGDLIRVSHDAPLWGEGWARIKSRTVLAGNVTALTLDMAVTMATGGAGYVLRVRRTDGTSQLLGLATVAGESATLVLAPAVATASAPAVGDLAMFGESDLESVEGIILAIMPEPNFGARITFADAAPDIHLAYSGPIPPFNSKITQAAPVPQAVPAKPIVEDVRSDETVLLLMPDGSLLTRILLLLAAQSIVSPAPTAAIEIQFRRADANGAWQRMPLQPIGAGVTEISVMPVADGALYDVRLRGVSALGVASDWAEVLDHLVIGKTSAPPDVDNLRREGNWLRWSYPMPPRDFAGFIVRHRPGSSAEWDDAIALHDGIVGPSEIAIEQLVGAGTRTLMVKAVDTAGNLSASPATAIIELGDADVANVVTLYDWSGDGFIGDIVNGIVSGGELLADDGALFWSGNDGAAFWSNDAALFWTPVFAEMTFTATFQPTIAEIGERLTLVVDITAGLWEIEYRTFGSALFWTGDAALFWSGDDGALFWAGSDEMFLPWPGEIVLTGEQYQIRATTAAGLVQGRITTLQGVVDVPDAEEWIEDVAIGAGGARLPIVNTYRSIRIVLLTLQDDGGAAANAIALDKDYTLGPLIQCFDKDDVATGGSVDAYVKGVAA